MSKKHKEPKAPHPLSVVKAEPRAQYCCPECENKDSPGTSYINHNWPYNHPYYLDHMNAHICRNSWHLNRVTAKDAKPTEARKLHKDQSTTRVGKKKSKKAKKRKLDLETVWAWCENQDSRPAEGWLLGLLDGSIPLSEFQSAVRENRPIEF